MSDLDPIFLQNVVASYRSDSDLSHDEYERLRKARNKKLALDKFDQEQQFALAYFDRELALLLMHQLEKNLKPASTDDRTLIANTDAGITAGLTNLTVKYADDLEVSERIKSVKMGKSFGDTTQLRASTLNLLNRFVYSQTVDPSTSFVNLAFLRFLRPKETEKALASKARDDQAFAAQHAAIEIKYSHPQVLREKLVPGFFTRLFNSIANIFNPAPTQFFEYANTDSIVERIGDDAKRYFMEKDFKPNLDLISILLESRFIGREFWREIKSDQWLPLLISIKLLEKNGHALFDLAVSRYESLNSNALDKAAFDKSFINYAASLSGGADQPYILPLDRFSLSLEPIKKLNESDAAFKLPTHPADNAQTLVALEVPSPTLNETCVRSTGNDDSAVRSPSVKDSSIVRSISDKEVSVARSKSDQGSIVRSQDKDDTSIVRTRDDSECSDDPDNWTFSLSGEPVESISAALQSDTLMPDISAILSSSTKENDLVCLLSDEHLSTSHSAEKWKIYWRALFGPVSSREHKQLEGSGVPVSQRTSDDAEDSIERSADADDSVVRSPASNKSFDRSSATQHEISESQKAIAAKGRNHERDATPQRSHSSMDDSVVRSPEKSQSRLDDSVIRSPQTPLTPTKRTADGIPVASPSKKKPDGRAALVAKELSNILAGSVTQQEKAKLAARESSCKENVFPSMEEYSPASPSKRHALSGF